VAAALVCAACVSCSRRAPPAPSLSPDAAAAAVTADPRAIARAEDVRHAKDIPPEDQRSHDPTVRRLAARAFARILDADDAPLLRALEDGDEQVVAWASYGLGESCKGREDAHVRAIAARMASWAATSLPDASAGSPLDSPAVMLRALGRCGGEGAEQTLRSWLRRPGVTPSSAEQAALALGDIAAKRGGLALESVGALLDAAEDTPPLDAALYAFGRADLLRDESFEPRLVAAARAALGRPGPARVFALRALARCKDMSVAQDLARMLTSRDATTPEQVEGARALIRLGTGAQAALVGALTRLVPGGDATVDAAAFAVLPIVVSGIADDLPGDAAKPLGQLARWTPKAGATGTTSAILRRTSAVRCAAAAKLAQGAWNSEGIQTCDLDDGEAGEKARLLALDRRAWTRARRAAWLELVRSSHVRVREAAIEATSHHPELGDAALPVLADALSAKEPGVVATAAEAIHAHPERAYVLAASERRAALDPRSPPPSAHPSRDLDPRIAAALRAALARPLPADLIETRTALLDASLAVSLPEGRDYAKAACKDVNTTVRARAAKALAAAGEKDATCTVTEAPEDPAPEIARELSHPTRVTFETDGDASLAIVFDPLFAPVATTRFVALARAGFYTGIAVHRVVPAFVVQFGDPGADGYGGSGQTLRCETSPVPFAPLDVGVALAGRDTGSSQLFVTLARHPHLDGEYAWVGRAEGDWSAVAEGDVIRAVRVEE
jgi:cyclophilin family peptidyl-prolyl cis-trans isomerase